MWKKFYELAIVSLSIYFKITSFFGNEKSIKAINGRKNWKKNLTKVNLNKTNYWIHSASHGEGLMASPLIKKILENKNNQIIITFFSPSGYENFQFSSDQIFKTYLPLDFRSNAKDFISLTKPKHAIFVKYDLWMNFIETCQKNKIPVSVFSSKFHKNQWYFKFYGKWANDILKKFSNIFTIDKVSKSFLTSKGFENVMYNGDTRYDQVSTNLIKSSLKIKSPCLILGSSWEREEKILSSVINDFPNIQYIIAPHEVDKKRLKKLKNIFGSKAKFYSEIDRTKKIPNVLIIDKIGLLADLYSLSDIAFVGGGFTGKLHNIIEPAAKGNKIIFGPKHNKFPEAQSMIDNEIAFIIKDKFDLTKILKSIKICNTNRKKSMNFILKNKGASEIVYRKIVNQI
tara:strand:+ start:4185 stop:5381 length:1197 start_codon:yes stop_codon:yes gene_type:complete